MASAIPFIWSKYIDSNHKSDKRQNDIMNGTLIIDENGIIKTSWDDKIMEQVKKEILEKEILESIITQEKKDSDITSLDIFQYIKDNDLKKVKIYFHEYTFSTINIKHIDGKTPLMVALELNHTKIAKFLLKYGADVNIKSNDGKLAFDYYSNHTNTDDNTVSMKLMKKLVTQDNLNIDMFEECYQSDYPFSFIGYLFDFNIDKILKDDDMTDRLMMYLILYAQHLTKDDTLELIYKFLNSIINLTSFIDRIQHRHTRYRTKTKDISACLNKLGEETFDGYITVQRFWISQIDKVLLKIQKVFDMELCVICHDEKPTVVTLPCYHKVCCKECYDIIDHMECCYCRTKINRTIKTEG